MGKLKKKDAAKIFREWVVQQDDFELDPETGLPVLPEGLHWQLGEADMPSGFYDLDIRYSKRRWVVRDPIGGKWRPSREELTGHAIRLLEWAAEKHFQQEKERREVAPLGAYPPNSVLK